MRTTQSAGLAGLAVALGFGLSACSAHLTMASTTPEPPPESAAVTPPPAEPQEDQAITQLEEQHLHHHHGGITRFVAMSLDTLGVEDEKRDQVARLQGDLEACMSPAREIEQNLLITLADGIAQGAIDKSRVDGITDSLEPAVAAEKDCAASALDQLHAVLSPSERAALVDKVRANFEVWREMNYQERAAADGRPRRLSRLARELALTSDQVDQIQASLPLAMSTHDGTFDKSRAEQRLSQFSSAFLGTSFEARSIPSYANTELGTYGAKRMILFFESVTPVLTPPQRQQLAEELREQASRQPAVSQK